MSESPLFLQKTPLSLIDAAAVGALGTIPFYLITGFLNIYLKDIGIITLEERVTLNIILLTLCAFTLPLAGYIAGKIGYIRIMVISGVTHLMLCLSFFKIIFLSPFSTVLSAELILLGISQFYVAPINAFISKLFPTSLRYKGTALRYCIGMALFGGTAPYVSTLLIKMTHSDAITCIYIIFISFL